MEVIKKVLVISTVGLIYDGITSVIISYLKAMDFSGLDIYVAGTMKVEPSIRRQLEDIGCRIVEFPNRQTETITYIRKLVKFIRKNNIEVVHAHGNSGTLVVEMLAAWLGGCKKRIAHSHNTRCNQVRTDKLLRPFFNIFYTDALACGNDAGKWLFGDKTFKVLKNGRDIKMYYFNQEMRNRIRKEYNLGSSLTIGHVGGFFEQKNHRFLSEIYHEIVRLQSDVKLFMIGDGPLKAEIEHLCKDIHDNVIFTGSTDRVPDLLQAMDGMILPSLFEGLPLVAIEWQINGLPCIVSTNITRECAVTNQIHFLPLEISAEEWAYQIVTFAKQNNRLQSAEVAAVKVSLNGFDIHDAAEKLKEIYM